MHTIRAMLLSAAALLAPLLAAAQQAQTASWVHVRAGPAREYPLVLQLPPAAPVSVQGCLSDFSWCDVIAPDGSRGWVYAGNLVYPYNNGSVTIIRYGPTIGLPVVGFVLGAYWGSYYSQRPWYRDRPRWDSWSHRPHRPGQVRPPPPTLPRPPRPEIQPPRPPRPEIQPPRPVQPRPQVRPPQIQPPHPPAGVRPPAPRRPVTRPVPRPGNGEPRVPQPPPR